MEYDPKVHQLQCPKCQHGMEEVSHEEIVVDRCTHCKGLWFDEDEAHHLRKLRGSEVLDSGAPSEGWKWDSRADIACPRCGKDMEKTGDPKQVHIWYEVCDEHGLFMDAGEFSDFKNQTPLDCLRGLIKGRRETTAP